MKFFIEKYLLDKTSELAFITIKKDGEFRLNGYEIPSVGLDVPIKNVVLVKGIKESTAQNNLNSMSIVDAMIYMIGIDSNFKYNLEYEKFLKAFEDVTDFNLKSYMGYMSKKYFDIGEFRDSLIYMKALITIYPDDTDVLYHYSIICQQLAKEYKNDEDKEVMGKFLMEALDKLEKLIDIDENYKMAYYHLGFHYCNQSQYLKAKLAWKKAIDLNVEEDIFAHIQENLGRIDYKVQYEEAYNLIFQGKYKEGLDILLHLEDEYSDWWNLLFMIGLAYKFLENIDEAQHYFEKVLLLISDQVDAIVELGLLQAQRGNLDLAIEYFQKAVKLRNDPEILCNLGIAYLNKGELSDAIYFIELAYELDPNDEITNACLEELNKYR